MKKILSAVICTACLLGSAPLVKAELQSQYVTHATSSVLHFAPRANQSAVISICATSDKAGSVIDFFAKTGSEQTVTATPTNGATVVYITNTGLAMTTNDVVVYYHDTSGTMDGTTVSAATTTNITLAAGITEAGNASDVVYEVSRQGQVAVGSNSVNLSGSAIFCTPKESPIRLVLDGTAACKLSATAVLTP